MGTSYKAYLDVIENIKDLNLSKDEKLALETERATNEREKTFI